MKSENNHAIRPLAKYIGLSSYLEQVKTKLMPRTSGSADQKCNGSSPYLLQKRHQSERENRFSKFLLRLNEEEEGNHIGEFRYCFPKGIVSDLNFGCSVDLTTFLSLLRK